MMPKDMVKVDAHQIRRAVTEHENNINQGFLVSDSLMWLRDDINKIIQGEVLYED